MSEGSALLTGLRRRLDAVLDAWDELCARSSAVTERLRIPKPLMWAVWVGIVFALPAVAYRDLENVGITRSLMWSAAAVAVGLVAGFWATRHPDEEIQRSQWQLWLRTMWWVHLPWIGGAAAALVLQLVAVVGGETREDTASEIGMGCTQIPVWLVLCALVPLLWVRAWGRLVLKKGYIHDPQAAARFWLAVLVTGLVSARWAFLPMG